MPPISVLWRALTPADQVRLLCLTRSPSNLRTILWWRWALRDLPLARRVIVPPAPERQQFIRWLREQGRLSDG